MAGTKKGTWTYITNTRYDGIMGRCYRSTDSSYHKYGARGIRVCEEWIRDINAFRDWMSEALEAAGIPIDRFLRNTRGYQVDRVNGNGHYTPDNCRIVSVQANNRNKKRCRRIYESAEGTLVEVA